MNKIKIKLTHPKAKIPVKAYGTDACYDIIAVSKEYIGYNRYKYKCGFHIELPANSQIDIRPRSSIYKTGLILSNSIGTVDEDYRGEFMVIFYHIEKELPPYEIGDRIAQIQLRSREDIEFILVDELSETERGSGGFGHTGN